MATSDRSGAETANARYPGRINLTARVYTGDAYTEKEVPMVIGVMGNFRGRSNVPVTTLQKRAFADVRPDTLNTVIAATEPAVKMEVNNHLANDGSKLAVTLKFKSMADFDPDAVVKSVPALNTILQQRQKLKELRNRLASNPDWRRVMQDILANPDKLDQLKRELGADQV